MKKTVVISGIAVLCLIIIGIVCGNKNPKTLLPEETAIPEETASQESEHPSTLRQLNIRI